MSQGQYYETVLFFFLNGVSNMVSIFQKYLFMKGNISKINCCQNKVVYIILFTA